MTLWLVKACQENTHCFNASFATALRVRAIIKGLRGEGGGANVWAQLLEEGLRNIVSKFHRPQKQKSSQ